MVNGRTIAEDMERECYLSSLRDTFAAAALTGLIANGDYSVESTPLLAFRMADAMVRERANHQAAPDSSTNHDAAPAAKATLPTVDHAAGRSRGAGNSPSDAGTGDTPNMNPMPVVVSGSGSVTPASYEKSDEKRVFYDTKSQPLAAGERVACGLGKRQPMDSPSLSCAESPVTDGRPAPAAEGTPAPHATQGEGTSPGECGNEPVGWVVVIPLGGKRFAVDEFFISHGEAQKACKWRIENTQRGAEVIPLYRSPTLTEAEREALQLAVKMAGDPSPITAPQVFEYAATLRGLLERMK